MTGRLTTHVLDAVRGRGAGGLKLRLSRGGALLVETLTNPEGRCPAPLLEGVTLLAGRYELWFAAADYLSRHHAPPGNPPFLEEIVLRFGVADPAQHYHVALLLSPHSYTMYRGS